MQKHSFLVASVVTEILCFISPLQFGRILRLTMIIALACQDFKSNHVREEKNAIFFQKTRKRRKTVFGTKKSPFFKPKMQNLLSCLKKKNVTQKNRKQTKKVENEYDGTKFNADKLISFLCKAPFTHQRA